MLPLNQVIQGNCLEILREWPEESVDLVMFSPPYWGLRNYGESTETVWGGDDCSHEWVEEIEKWHSGTDAGEKQKTVRGSFHNDAFSSHGFCANCGAWRGQLGLEPYWQMYVKHMVLVCRGLKRVLKQTGSIYIVLGDTYAGSHCGTHDYRENYQPKCLMGIPWRVAFALIDDGWVLRERIVWHKGNPMPGSQKDRLTQTCETIFHFVKNAGKALLWRNELTGEWLSQRPKQVYFHVETHKLRDDRPPKEERYAIDEFGTRHLVWKSLWRGFDYYYELDIIRQPHSTSTIKRVSQKTVFQQKGGIKQDMLRGTRDPSKGNQSRCAEMVKSIAFNLRVRDAKRGKKGFFVEGGKVKQLKASQEEVENYVYPEGLTKHDVAMKNCPTVNREGGLGYTDPLHVKAYHERGKNPGDVTEGLKDILNEIMKTYEHVADVEVEEWMGKSSSLDPQHSFRRLGLNTRKNRVRFEIALDKLEIQGLLRQRLITYWHNHPIHPRGSNPGDFWNICTKPFKGAHFAVYPEAICVNPILSSCPPGGTVLDPMCGSGTTLVVAKKLGRNFVGVEINPAYVAIARKRLEAVPERLDKFMEDNEK